MKCIEENARIFLLHMIQILDCLNIDKEFRINNNIFDFTEYTS